jgi:hypothetical protein
MSEAVRARVPTGAACHRRRRPQTPAARQRVGSLHRNRCGGGGGMYHASRVRCLESGALSAADEAIVFHSRGTLASDKDSGSPQSRTSTARSNAIPRIRAAFTTAHSPAHELATTNRAIRGFRPRDYTERHLQPGATECRRRRHRRQGGQAVTRRHRGRDAAYSVPMKALILTDARSDRVMRSLNTTQQ